MRIRLYRYIVPGLVIQAVMVGGGYATGRELVEFFVSKGPATGLAGLALTAWWFSCTAVVSFELARRYNVPRGLRPALALGIMVTAVFVASSFGIIDLIGQGYRYSSYFFLLVFLLPLAVRRGVWVLLR